MAPEPCVRRLARALSATAFACAFLTPPAHALRIVDYNVTNYPSVLFPQRQPYFRTVFDPLDPDVVVCQEFTSAAGVDSFRANVLNALDPGEWASVPFTNGTDTDNAFFYKTARVAFLGQRAFYVSSDVERYVNEYRFKPTGYASDAAEIRIYSIHLKASDTSADRAQRLREATGLRDTMNNAPPGTHMILAGDYNIYTSTELAYQKVLESQADNDGRLFDPLNPLNQVQGWHNGPSFAPIHTQCPCGDNPTPSRGCPAGGGFSGGGLDDRFDMFLHTYNLGDGEGLDLLVSTYKAIGQDGLHYNVPITDPPTIPEGAAYATALINASDHLPILVDLQLPAQIGTAPALAFGSVIVGGPAAQNLAVSNPATVPADELDYSFSAPPGFGAPGGVFTLNAGAPAATHAITMSTASAGNMAGNLGIASDDPDHPVTLVALSGTVLDHASASLDSATAVLDDTLDFGDHPSGQFSNQLAHVHNRGYDALQARLSVTGGVITGGDGRFSIVGGFSPALVAGTAQSYTMAFNESGATQDSAHFATLTFTSADEPLPGATPQPDLTLTMRARPTSTVVGVGDRSFVPGATRLFPPFPNPLAGETTLRLDLARPAGVRLEVFDLTGRRVALIADRALEPGRYSFGWDGCDAGGGALGAGLYLVRLSGPGLKAQSTRLAIVR